MKKQKIGDLQFWRETIVFYRNAALSEKNLKRRIRLAKCLNEARGYMKYAESKLLVLVLLAILLCSGCQTVEGFRADIHKLTEPPQTK